MQPALMYTAGKQQRACASVLICNSKFPPKTVLVIRATILGGPSSASYLILVHNIVLVCQ